VTVLIDPPLWPRHGTVWGHLVSDTSYAELHAFAERAGLPRRAFGAVPVSTRELVRRLRASGLRVPARDRRATPTG